MVREGDCMHHTGAILNHTITSAVMAQLHFLNRPFATAMKEFLADHTEISYQGNFQDCIERKKGNTNGHLKLEGFVWKLPPLPSNDAPVVSHTNPCKFSNCHKINPL